MTITETAPQFTVSACGLPHWYTVEVVGDVIRYAGSDSQGASSALMTIGEDEEGYVVAEHQGDCGYCPRESGRIEAMAIAADFDEIPALAVA